jgi:hypothetical protein
MPIEASYPEPLGVADQRCFLPASLFMAGVKVCGALARLSKVVITEAGEGCSAEVEVWTLLADNQIAAKEKIVEKEGKAAAGQGKQ